MMNFSNTGRCVVFIAVAPSDEDPTTPIDPSEALVVVGRT